MEAKQILAIHILRNFVRPGTMENAFLKKMLNYNSEDSLTQKEKDWLHGLVFINKNNIPITCTIYKKDNHE